MVAEASLALSSLLSPRPSPFPFLLKQKLLLVGVVESIASLVAGKWTNVKINLCSCTLPGRAARQLGFVRRSGLMSSGAA